jgi:polyhydroxybutyrate depolymerase
MRDTPFLLASLLALLLAAPWAAAQRGKFSQPGKNTAERTITVDKRQRTYLLHVPPGLPRDKAVPLVLIFHGGGGQAAGTETYLTHFSELADKEGFLVAYPEGVGKNWNDGRDNPSSVAATESVDDLAFVLALMADVGKDHRIDPRRVYATGISNGGIFSHYLAANHADKIAAIAPVAGGLADPFFKKFRPGAPVSVLILQGTQDPLVPYGGGKIGLGNRGKVIGTDETVRLWVKSNGCAAEPTEEALPDRDPKDGCRVTRFSYGKGRGGSEVVLYRIEGGGHTWPGGPQYLSERFIGRVCRDIDATAVIWEFFKAHPKR